MLHLLIRTNERGIILIGYARVSTQDQNTALQEDALNAKGCERVYIEKASGAKEDRPILADMLKNARQGDTIVVWKLDRLARSIRQLIEIAAGLRERGINIMSISDGIDTSTTVGEFTFHVLGALAQFERGLIRERVRAGIKAAQERGAKSGRKPMTHIDTIAKLDHARALVAGGMKPAQAAKLAGIGRTTLYKYLGERPQNSRYGKTNSANLRTDLRTVSLRKIAA